MIVSLTQDKVDPDDDNKESEGSRSVETSGKGPRPASLNVSWGVKLCQDVLRWWRQIELFYVSGASISHSFKEPKRTESYKSEKSNIVAPN